MRSLLLIYLLFFLLNLYSFNKDSLRFSAVDKGSQYIHANFGMIYVKKDGEYFGHANRMSYDYEYFIKNKYSISSGLMVNYSYQKYSNDQLKTSLSFVGRKYFKIKRAYFLNVFSAISLVNSNLSNRVDPELSFIKGGITFSNGIGFTFMPTRKKKNSLSRFGFQCSFNLLSFYTTKVTRFPYSTMGIQYRLN